ncbi:MAG: tol-pal system protein YbgF [Alphaproteobacteria bacterium]
MATGAGTPAAGFRFPWRAVLLLSAVAVVAAGLGATVPGTRALAQDANVSRELERLRRDLNDLQRYVYKGKPSGQSPPAVGAAGPEVAARMQLQITRMQGQIRAMNGRIEEAQHKIGLLEKRIDTMASDLELRLRAIEDAIAAGAAVPTDGGAPGKDGSARQPGAIAGYPDGGTVREQYDFSFDLLKTRKYAAAASSFQMFLDKNPKDALSGNALYWLGETRYVQKNYKEAAKVFLDGYKRFPKGAKAPDNLLKLGMSLAALGQSDSACKTLRKLLDTFPKASSKVRGAATTERKKQKCK